MRPSTPHECGSYGTEFLRHWILSDAFRFRNGTLLSQQSKICRSQEVLPVEQPNKDPQFVYVKVYKHYRTGKLMIASEYGYTSWRFLNKKKK